MADDVSPSEITPPSVYFNRKALLRGAVTVASVATTAAIYRRLNGRSEAAVKAPKLEGLAQPSAAAAAEGYRVDEPMTSLDAITHYNNFYEFSTDKDGVADRARGFQTAGWRVSVGGLVAKPRVFDLDDLLKLSPPEERVYRMRCVEAWSMVIPWAGFSLSKLLERVEPLSGARYVAFETLLDPARMPGQRTGVLDWPYIEGLRMDEAMHPLTMLALGPVRARAAGAGRRARAPGGALEVRLQGDQVDRQDLAGGHAAADHLEPAGAGRVWLLREREPARRSPALEPGDRAAHRRVGPPPDA